MKNRILFWIGALLMLSACGPLELERQGIPIVYGMRINDAEDAMAFAPNVQSLENRHLSNLFIELPLRADSMDLPIVSERISASMLQLLIEKQFKYHLGICTINEKELFPEGALMSPKAWFSNLEAQLRSVLNPLTSYLPKRLIIGSDLKPSYTNQEEWRRLFVSLRKSFPGVLFSIGGRASELEQGGMAAISDEFAIDYPPLVGEDLKAQSREMNDDIGRTALELKKPVFLFRGNIMGPKPKIQIQNRFRFWPNKLEIRGICINSLTAKVPPRDAKTYYGLADNPEALTYLEVYQNKDGK